MTKSELKSELNKINVPKEHYSLNEGIKVDAYIVEKYNDIWRYYYFDEKGQGSDLNLFKSEEDAYIYLLKEFKEQLKLLGKKSF